MRSDLSEPCPDQLVHLYGRGLPSIVFPDELADAEEIAGFSRQGLFNGGLYREVIGVDMVVAEKGEFAHGGGVGADGRYSERCGLERGDAESFSL
jgi:hypothetical protein